MKLTAETTIAGDPETVWRLTQDPAQHVRWDARFTEIKPLPRAHPDEPQRFSYATQMSFGLVIQGWGETVAQHDGRGSALRFGSDHPLSLIREGSGCWVYQEEPDGLRFGTVYDYAVRHGWPGRLLDRLLFRPLMIAATRWSFDRLRLWIERGIAPELSLRLWLLKVGARLALGLVWIWEGLMPKLLFASPGEIDLVRRSGVFWGSPEGTLAALGAAEVLAGLWLLSGRAERRAVLLATLTMIALAALVVMTDPTTLANPFGGLSKNLGLIVCALVVWTLAPITPTARRAAPRRRKP